MELSNERMVDELFARWFDKNKQRVTTMTMEEALRQAFLSGVKLDALIECGMDFI